MNEIRLVAVDEVFYRVECERSVAAVIADELTFYAANYKYHPKVKLGVWDGKISLLDYRTKRVYRGLADKIAEIADQHNFDLAFEPERTVDTLTLADVERLYDELIPAKFDKRDYQLQTIQHCLNHRRATIVSPVNSGKSMMIYMVARILDQQTLIIVPNTGLCRQFQSDLIGYGADPSEIKMVFSGEEKDVGDARYVISTWQSAIRMPRQWFERFGTVFGDEAHRCKATSLIEVMSRCVNASNRFGFTGTLDHTEPLSIHTIVGLFGPIATFISNAEMIERGYSAEMQINLLVLKHRKADCQQHSKIQSIARAKGKGGKAYQLERMFVVQSEARNKFITKLVIGLKGNTLAIVRLIEAHGKPLFEMIQQKTNQPTYFVNGKVDSDDREQIRRIINTHTDSITVASAGCFSEGINVPNIDNIVLISGGKSTINTMQILGRGLRKSERKSKCNVYDVADDLRVVDNSARYNLLLKHAIARTKMYDTEGFPYKEFRIPL